MLTEINRKIAVLIDAENAQASKIEDILKDISTYGRIVTKRAYANWTKAVLKPWEKEVKRFAIGTIQQFDFASGKNASDMALTIDAMDLLYTKNYDCFVIVSSDSDFTSLAMKLHESGAFVVGYGNKQTVVSFRNACDEFNYVEDLSKDEREISGLDAEIKNKSAKETGEKNEINDRLSEDSENDSGAALVMDNGAEKTIEGEMLFPENVVGGNITEGELDELLRKAEEKYAGEDGFVNVSSAGTYIKRVHSDFNIKSLGYDKLPAYLRTKEAVFEMKERKGKGDVKLILYRSK